MNHNDNGRIVYNVQLLLHQSRGCRTHDLPHWRRARKPLHHDPVCILMKYNNN